MRENVLNSRKNGMGMMLLLILLHLLAVAGLAVGIVYESLALIILCILILSFGLQGGLERTEELLRLTQAHGVPVVDADRISRALTAEGGEALPALRAAFGDGVFDGERLNRAALAKLIFSDEKKREILNAILHPLIFISVAA